MKIVAETYNYTTQEAGRLIFPLTSEKIDENKYAGQEIMIDGCEYFSFLGVGKNIEEFQNFVEVINESGTSEEGLKILSKTYLPEEIYEILKDGDSFVIVDFDQETYGWSAASIISDDDKGRVLYECGYTVFPVEVPEELEDYMDYAALWRDASIGKDIRVVNVDGSGYLVWIM